MPVGTNATVKALSPDDLRDVGASIILSQHLPPLPAAGPRADRAARRAAPVHGLGPADPHRLGRVPGRLARRPAGRRRGRRDVPLAPRRVGPSLHAGARDRRSRRRSARTSRSPSTSRSSRARRATVVADATERTHRWAERSLAAHTRPDQAMFGIVQGGLDPELRAASTRFIAALPFDGSASAGWPATRRPRSATRRSTSPCRCWPTTRGRAT